MPVMHNNIARRKARKNRAANHPPPPSSSKGPSSSVNQSGEIAANQSKTNEGYTQVGSAKGTNRRRPRKDPDNYEAYGKQYIKFSMKVEEITLSGRFNFFIIAVIVLAGILVGVQTYGCPEEEVKYYCKPGIADSRALAVMDGVILTIFSIECVMKILAEGMEPWRYFTGPERAWNIFDFVIVFLCMPFIPIGSNVALLRLMRLLRVMKLVKKIPQLQMICQGLISGMKSIGYIGLLLFMIFYLYAILGMTLFKDNDPWHFGDIFVAFNTLFRMMTLEDWTDVMYVNLYGCDSFLEQGDRFDSGFFTKNTKAHAYMPHSDNVTLFDCDPVAAEAIRSVPNMWVAVLYFFSFVVLSALVALSLILGAITMGMADSMEQMKAQKEENNRLEKLAAAEKRLKKYNEGRRKFRLKSIASGIQKTLKLSKLMKMKAKRDAKVHPIGSPEGKHTNVSKFLSISNRDLILKNRDIVMKHSREFAGNSDSDAAFTSPGPPKTRIAFSPKITPKPRTVSCIEKRANTGKETKAQPEEKNANAANMKKRRVSKAVSALLDDVEAMPKTCLQRWGIEEDGSSNDLMRVVLLSAWNGERVSFDEIRRGFELSREENTGPYFHLSQVMEKVRDNSYFVNFVTCVILGAGIVVGFEAEWGEADWTDLANNIILGVFIVEIVVKVVAEDKRPIRYFYHHEAFDKWNVFDFVVVAGSVMPMGSATSIVTMLRLLRLLRVLKLVKAFPQLQVIVEALMNGVKSIYYIGIIMFMFFYIFGILGMILFQNNDPWHFGTLGYTLVTLFRMATLEDWTDVMYINMHGCKYYGYGDYPEFCIEENSVPETAMSRICAVMYCWVIVIFGGLILVPLFIGVVVSSMEEAVSRQKDSQAAQAAVDAIIAKGELPIETVELYCKVFTMLDVDCGGTVDMDELVLGLNMVDIQISERELSSHMDEVLAGEENEGELNLPQFISFMSSMKGENMQKLCKTTRSPMGLLATIKKRNDSRRLSLSPKPTPPDVKVAMSPKKKATDPADEEARKSTARTKLETTTENTVVSMSPTQTHKNATGGLGPRSRVSGRLGVSDFISRDLKFSEDSQVSEFVVPTEAAARSSPDTLR